jgi:hypothetical protein
MDVVRDADLLWIAQQAVTAELPPGWEEHADPMSGDSYCEYPDPDGALRSTPTRSASLVGSPSCRCWLADHNSSTGETAWEHPCDAYYRDLYKQLRDQKLTHIDPMVALTQAALPPNRYLDPLRQEKQTAEARQKKAEQTQVRRAERLKRNRARREVREKRCAKRIQRAWRARRYRHSINAFIRDKRCAVRIQAHQRGNQARTRLRCAPPHPTLLACLHGCRCDGLSLLAAGREWRGSSRAQPRRGCSLRRAAFCCANSWRGDSRSRRPATEPRPTAVSIAPQPRWGAADVASFLAAVLPEMYLCGVCACHQMLRRHGRCGQARQVSGPCRHATQRRRELAGRRLLQPQLRGAEAAGPLPRQARAARRRRCGVRCVLCGGRSG